MRIELADAELDGLYRYLLTRPMGEVEPFVNGLRRAVSAAQAPAAPPKDEAPAGLPEGAWTRPNGAGEGDDSPGLP
jgi:hypothetical protein